MSFKSTKTSVSLPLTLCPVIKYEVFAEKSKTLWESSYPMNTLFQMLKRGIGIYTEDMPEEYKWILQKLMDDKKIGIVISDRICVWVLIYPYDLRVC